jgi:hypothetical protein
MNAVERACRSKQDGRYCDVALDDDSHRFLSFFELWYKICAAYEMDIEVRLLSAVLWSNVMKLRHRELSEQCRLGRDEASRRNVCAGQHPGTQLS